MATKADLHQEKLGQDEACNIKKLPFHVPRGWGKIAGLLLFICPHSAVALAGL